MRRGAGQAALLAAAATIGVLAVLPGTAGARGITTGFSDGLFGSTDTATRNLWLDRAVEARAGSVRLTANWGSLAPTRPSNPDDPADPQYRFAELDVAVRSATAHGLTPLITVYRAPTWAEGPGRSINDPEGTWKPNAAEFGHFATALATRYSGSYPDPLGGTLPRVRFFEVWNEPNLNQYLSPQYENRKLVGPILLRGLLNAFYDAAHAVHPDNVVISGGTAPYGENPGGNRTRPLIFIRALLCLKGEKKLRRARCDQQPKLDALAHHPINTSGGAYQSAFNRNDVSSPDLPEVQKVLRASARLHTASPRGRKALWVTEFWWNSNPPNPVRGAPPLTQARWIEEALYLFWKAHAQVAINLQIRDAEFLPTAPLDTSQAGIYFLDGTAKPSATAFRFPFVVARAKKGKKAKKRQVWGKAPTPGQVLIQRFSGATWRTVRGARTDATGTFVGKVKARRGQSFRAVSGAEASLDYTVG